jgi:hypothetical protein
MCFDFLYNNNNNNNNNNYFMKSFFILRRNEWDVIKQYIGVPVSYPLFVADVKEGSIFPTNVRKIFKYEISWKSIQREPSFSMQTEGQTHRETDRHDDTNSRFFFQKFANKPKI